MLKSYDLQFGLEYDGNLVLYTPITTPQKLAEISTLEASTSFGRTRYFRGMFEYFSI
jgi:hypothetical protein